MRAMLLASLLVASAAVAVAAVKPLPKFDRVMTMDTPRAVGDLAMTDQDGEPKRISDLAGAPTLVFFGFTNCPEICPTTLQQLALIKSSRAKELAGLRIAFISVDGERDTPAVMKEYLKRFPGGIRRPHGAGRTGAQPCAAFFSAILQGSAQGWRVRRAALEPALRSRPAGQVTRRDLRRLARGGSRDRARAARRVNGMPIC